MSATAEQRKIQRKTVCPLDCPDSCGLIATIEKGRVVSLAGDDSHPYTRGLICRKMKNYPERVYADKRILFPLKRDGRKGDGKFVRISWEEAYTLLTERINTIRESFGGEAILPFAYAGNMGTINRFAGYPLFHKLGTSRLAETICSTAAKAGWRSQCGDVPGTPPETAEDADLIVIWGSNTKVTNLHFWPYVVAARKRGAKLVVIDPYRNITASSADLHLMVEPGEDTALALALLKTLDERSALDNDFIASATTEFASLQRYFHSLNLNDLAAKSGVAPEQIQQFADLLQERAKTFIRLGVGMTRNSRAAMGIRAVTSLAAALGLFDGKKGRGVLLTTSAFKGEQSKLTWPSLAGGKSRTFNMVQLGNCLTRAEPPVKMLLVYNANPLSVTPDGSLVRQALASEELFTVVHEQVMTPTAKYADLLLPATTFLENKDIYTSYGHFYMSVVEAAIGPCGEARNNFDFFQELALRLGFRDEPFLQSLEERMADYLGSLNGLPDTFAPDRYEYGKPYLSTRCRKAEPLFSKSSTLYSFVDTSAPAIPETACLQEGAEFDNADYLTRYPFKLITPPHMDLLNSTFGERYEGETGEVLVHPRDAASHDVSEGDQVTLYNGRGWTRRRVKVSEATREGLLVAEGIFWQFDNHPSGINDLTSQRLTDMGGGGTFHESRVALLTSK